MNAEVLTNRRGEDPHELYRDLPDLGSELVSKERFTSVEYMQREWDRLWTKIWNMGPRVEEIPKPGDYVLHTLGRESFIFVRTRSGEIKGFFNVCPHRGNRVCTGAEKGHRPFFACGYHAWKWDLEGHCVDIPDMADFPQFRDGAPQDAVGLTPVKVQSWAGWIWFNMNPDCAPLEGHLGPIKERLDAYQVEKMRFLEYKTFLWPCNWKIANDAFNESYHFAATHPEMIKYSEDISRQELIGDHSLMVIQYGTVSGKVAEREKMNPYLAEWMQNVYGMDPATYEGAAKDVRLAHQREVREKGLGMADYGRLSDETMTDDHAYLIFPNVNWQSWSEHIGGYRMRPHPTDPNQCYFDLYFMGFIPEGTEPPAFTHEVIEGVQGNLTELMSVSPLAALAVEQDSSNVKAVQEGMHSAGFRGLVLGNQEIRLRHFYQTLDRYLATND